jgi:hypothetical protein
MVWDKDTLLQGLSLPTVARYTIVALAYTLAFSISTVDPRGIWGTDPEFLRSGEGTFGMHGLFYRLG